MTFAEKRDKVDSMLQRLHELMDMKLGTKTAEAIWKERLTFYITFYEKLKEQLANSTEIMR
jgi:uncharacterized protein